MAEDVIYALGGCLKNLGQQFKSNRLAYLSLTSKNERELCGLLAHCLQRKFGLDGGRLVVREWAAEPHLDEDGKIKYPRIDIAVLKGGEPLLMIEAKAAMSFNLVENWGGMRPRCYPSAEVSEDVEKLKRVAHSSDSYVLTFFTHAHCVPCEEHREGIPYFDGINKHSPITEGCIMDGFKRFREAAECKAQSCLPVVYNGQIHAGKAFHVDVSVYWWLLEVPFDSKE